jgi:hypothetical protein
MRRRLSPLLLLISAEMHKPSWVARSATSASPEQLTMMFLTFHVCCGGRRVCCFYWCVCSRAYGIPHRLYSWYLIIYTTIYTWLQDRCRAEMAIGQEASLASNATMRWGITANHVIPSYHSENHWAHDAHMKWNDARDLVRGRVCLCRLWRTWRRSASICWRCSKPWMPGVNVRACVRLFWCITMYIYTHYTYAHTPCNMINGMPLLSSCILQCVQECSYGQDRIQAQSPQERQVWGGNEGRVLYVYVCVCMETKVVPPQIPCLLVLNTSLFSPQHDSSDPGVS